MAIKTMDDKTKAALLARAKPILFNDEMVRALLDDIKTETRRVIKPQPTADPPMYCYAGSIKRDIGRWRDKSGQWWTPPCHADDILYVRETWCEYDADHIIDGVRYAYKADATPNSEEARRELGYKWHPSINMPKDAARIFLRVTDVRIERLQDISGESCQHEGIAHARKRWIHASTLKTYGADRFAPMWESTIKPADRDRYGWHANPWVWVIEFERIGVDNDGQQDL